MYVYVDLICVCLGGLGLVRNAFKLDIALVGRSIFAAALTPHRSRGNTVCLLCLRVHGAGAIQLPVLSLDYCSLFKYLCHNTILPYFSGAILYLPCFCCGLHVAAVVGHVPVGCALFSSTHFDFNV